MAITGFSSVPQILTEQTLTPTIISAATISNQTFTVKGLRTNMTVLVDWPGLESDCIIGGCEVSSTDTLKIKFYSVAGLTPAAALVKIVAF